MGWKCDDRPLEQYDNFWRLGNLGDVATVISVGLWLAMHSRILLCSQLIQLPSKKKLSGKAGKANAIVSIPDVVAYESQRQAHEYSPLDARWVPQRIV